MKNILYLLLPLAIASCAPTRFVKPLEEGQHAVTASYGGPIARVPGVATFPTPFTSLTYGYGLRENTAAFASWYPTASIFGVFQSEVGVVQQVWSQPDGLMGVTVTPEANFMIDRWERNFKFYPQLDASFYWTYGLNNSGDNAETGGESGAFQNAKRLYFGFSNWWELADTRAHDVPQSKRWLFTPHIGHSFFRPKWEYQLELKFIGTTVDNEALALDYVSATGNQGALGFYFGLTRRF